MTSYLGVDWARSGWVVVNAGDEIQITTEPAFLNVWHKHGKRDDVKSILVDIPIGLPDTGMRACDKEAMDFLGNRRSTVFAIPSREVVESDEYATAKCKNGGSLGSQSWWLFPRIREVDVFLQENAEAREKVYESHPEICFRARSQCDLAPKSTDKGRKERLDILKAGDSELYEEVNELVECRLSNAEWHHRISKGKIDDVVDAACLAVTAKKIGLGKREQSNGYPALPKKEEALKDNELGIDMQIIHPNEQSELAKG